MERIQVAITFDNEKARRAECLMAGHPRAPWSPIVMTDQEHVTYAYYCAEHDQEAT